MTEQDCCCKSSFHLATQMVKLLLTVLFSCLVIVNSARGPRRQNVCLNYSHLAFQHGHQWVAAEAARTVEVVGTVVAEMPRIKNQLKALIIVIINCFKQKRPQLTPIRLASGGYPRMELFGLSKSFLKLKWTKKSSGTNKVRLLY